MDLDEKFPFADFLEEFNEINRIDTFILRAHLYCEHYLENILKHYVEDYDPIADFRFRKKFDVTKALGIFNSPIEENIKLLNRMRNDLVHNLDVDSTYEEKIEPRLKQLNWGVESKEKREALREAFKKGEDNHPHGDKVVNTLAIMNNQLAYLEDGEKEQENE